MLGIPFLNLDIFKSCDLIGYKAELIKLHLHESRVLSEESAVVYRRCLVTSLYQISQVLLARIIIIHK